MLLSRCSNVPVFCYYPGSGPSVNFAVFSSVLITEDIEQDDAPLVAVPCGSEDTALSVCTLKLQFCSVRRN